MIQYFTTSLSVLKQCTIYIMKHCLYSTGRLQLKFLVKIKAILIADYNILLTSSLFHDNNELYPLKLSTRSLDNEYLGVSNTLSSLPSISSRTSKYLAGKKEFEASCMDWLEAALISTPCPRKPVLCHKSKVTNRYSPNFVSTYSDEGFAFRFDMWSWRKRVINNHHISFYNVLYSSMA